MRLPIKFEDIDGIMHELFCFDEHSVYKIYIAHRKNRLVEVAFSSNNKQVIDIVKMMSKTAKNYCDAIYEETQQRG